MNDFFADNLEVLRQVDPLMATRLCRALDDTRVLRLADGTLVYRYIQSYVALALGVEQCAQVLASEFRERELAAAEPVLVFGAGLGELPQAVLASTDAAVVVWDRDPFLFRLMLASHDFRSELRSRRLTLSLGVDLLQILPLVGMRLVRHPLFAQVYKNENILLDEPLLKPLAFIAEGALFIEDVSDALRREGYSVYTLDLIGLSNEELDESIARTRPQVMFRINHIEGLATLSERMKLATVVWEIDPAFNDPLPAPQSNAYTHIFTWRRRNVHDFEKIGFHGAQHLPLAANPKRRFPVMLAAKENREFAAQLAFVGGSMAQRNEELRADFLAAWEESCPEQQVRGEQILASVLDLQRKDLSTYRVPELFAMHAPTLAVARGKLDPIRIAGEFAAAERRLRYVEALAPLGITVWGDEGWRQVPGIDWRGPAEHGVTINKVYSNAAVNLDIGRLYQLDIVTMRVFDVLACAGFLLAEHSDELAEIFAIGEELDSWQTLEELAEKAKWYLAHPAVARRIAERGYRAVCDRHTIQQRVRFMLTSSVPKRGPV
jgi:spore maturation protein CgeB